jgi:hypothetical protein
MANYRRLAPDAASAAPVYRAAPGWDAVADLVERLARSGATRVQVSSFDHGGPNVTAHYPARRVAGRRGGPARARVRPDRAGDAHTAQRWQRAPTARPAEWSQQDGTARAQPVSAQSIPAPAAEAPRQPTERKKKKKLRDTSRAAENRARKEQQAAPAKGRNVAASATPPDAAAATPPRTCQAASCPDKTTRLVEPPLTPASPGFRAPPTPESDAEESEGEQECSPLVEVAPATTQEEPAQDAAGAPPPRAAASPTLSSWVAAVSKTPEAGSPALSKTPEAAVPATPPRAILATDSPPRSGKRAPELSGGRLTPAIGPASVEEDGTVGSGEQLAKKANLSDGWTKVGGRRSSGGAGRH